MFISMDFPVRPPRTSYVHSSRESVGPITLTLRTILAGVQPWWTIAEEVTESRFATSRRSSFNQSGSSTRTLRVALRINFGGAFGDCHFSVFLSVGTCYASLNTGCNHVATFGVRAFECNCDSWSFRLTGLGFLTRERAGA